MELQLLQLCGLMGIALDSNPHFHLLVLNSLRLCTRVQCRTIVIRSVYVAVLFEMILTEFTYQHQLDKYRIPSTPSIQYNRKEWWDNLVMSYSATRDQSYVIYIIRARIANLNDRLIS